MFIESNQSQVFEYLFEIKSVQQNKKISTSNQDTYVSMVAIEKQGDEKISKTRKRVQKNSVFQLNVTVQPHNVSPRYFQKKEDVQMSYLIPNYDRRRKDRNGRGENVDGQHQGANLNVSKMEH